MSDEVAVSLSPSRASVLSVGQAICFVRTQLDVEDGLPRLDPGALYDACTAIEEANPPTARKDWHFKRSNPKKATYRPLKHGASKINKIENGETPSSDVLPYQRSVIARALGLPREFFFGDEYTEQDLRDTYERAPRPPTAPGPIVVPKGALWDYFQRLVWAVHTTTMPGKRPGDAPRHVVSVVKFVLSECDLNNRRVTYTASVLDPHDIPCHYKYVFQDFGNSILGIVGKDQEKMAFSVYDGSEVAHGLAYFGPMYFTNWIESREAGFSIVSATDISEIRGNSKQTEKFQAAFNLFYEKRLWLLEHSKNLILGKLDEWIKKDPPAAVDGH